MDTPATIKGLTAGLPMSSGKARSGGTLRRNRDLLSRLCSQRSERDVKEATNELQEEGEATTLLRGFFSALAPPVRKPDRSCVDKDVASISRVVAAVDEAVRASTVTEEEGDAVIDFLINRFVERRVNDTLRHLAAPKYDSWFLAACESSHDG